MQAATPPSSAPPRIRERLVYYISGFDPRGARYYYSLYKSEAEAQGPVDGWHYEVGPRTRPEPNVSSWEVTATRGEQVTHTVYKVLGWDDLVRSFWIASLPRLYGVMPEFYIGYRAALRKTWAHAPMLFGSVVAPLVMGVGLPVLAALLALALFALGVRLAGGWALGLGAGLGAAAALLRWGWKAAQRLQQPWMMRINIFVHRWGRDRPASLDERWALFAQQIERDLARSTADEVVIVGHSIGGIAAIDVVDRWLAALPPGSAVAGGRVKLLTLGQVCPSLGWMPQAPWYLDKLARVAASGLVWIDYTSAHDPICCSLIDPLEVCGLGGVARPGYQLRSARFDKMFEPKAYAELKRDSFRIHFQYLSSAPLPARNSYFRLTAGNEPLEWLPPASR